ncbi:MAG: hypothetical protein NC350_04280 [Corallococcus sp.]|nr:hypothetical protein [Corallococcus sp.]
MGRSITRVALSVATFFCCLATLLVIISAVTVSMYAATAAQEFRSGAVALVVLGAVTLAAALLLLVRMTRIEKSTHKDFATFAKRNGQRLVYYIYSLVYAVVTAVFSIMVLASDMRYGIYVNAMAVISLIGAVFVLLCAALVYIDVYGFCKKYAKMSPAEAAACEEKRMKYDDEYQKKYKKKRKRDRG